MSSQTKSPSLRSLIYAIFRHPGLNLAINSVMLLVQAYMAAKQALQGDTSAAAAFLASCVGCVTAVVYWILVWWSDRHK